MKVSELIAALQRAPGDLEVWHNDETGGIAGDDANLAYIEALSPEVVLGLLNRLAGMIRVACT